jgi:hypothetical protein
MAEEDERSAEGGAGVPEDTGEDVSSPDEGSEQEFAPVQERFSSVDLKLPDEQLGKKRGLDANSLGLRYPIWYAACRFDKFSCRLTCQGLKDRGSDFLMLQSLGDPDSWATRQLKHPDIKALSAHIVKYLHGFHSDDLDVVYDLYISCVCNCASVHAHVSCGHLTV